MRTFYSDYIQHCLRFYVRHPRPSFKSSADKANWLACDDTLKRLSEDERELISLVYRERDSITDCVYEASVKHNISQDKVWNLISDVERKIAKRRGLI